jgi:predicted HicB family RNase H-like nuclease
LAKILIELVDKYGLKKIIITYVKNEGGLEESFWGTCFGHAFSKACQYGITKEKNCKNLKYVSIKFAQAYLHKMHHLA